MSEYEKILEPKETPEKNIFQSIFDEMYPLHKKIEGGDRSPDILRTLAELNLKGNILFSGDSDKGAREFIKDEEEGVNLLLEAFEKGDIKARADILKLILYIVPKPEERKEYGEKLKHWIGKINDFNFVDKDSLFKIGSIYELGARGIEENQELAIQYYLKAEGYGPADEAFYNLGRELYIFADNIPDDKITHSRIIKLQQYIARQLLEERSNDDKHNYLRLLHDMAWLKKDALRDEERAKSYFERAAECVVENTELLSEPVNAVSVFQYAVILQDTVRNTALYYTENKIEFSEKDQFLLMRDLQAAEEYFKIAAGMGNSLIAENSRECLTKNKKIADVITGWNKTLRNERYASIKNNTNPSSSSSSGGCYIATAVYGSYDCPEVWTLRRFRDFILYENILGRIFITLYYAISPTLVAVFGDAKWFKAMGRKFLDRLVSTLNDNGLDNTPYEDRKF